MAIVLDYLTRLQVVFCIIGTRLMSTNVMKLTLTWTKLCFLQYKNLQLIYAFMAPQSMWNFSGGVMCSSKNYTHVVILTTELRIVADRSNRNYCVFRVEVPSNRVSQYDCVTFKFDKVSRHRKYTLITLVPITYLRSWVIRAVYWHRTGVAQVGSHRRDLVPVVDDFCSQLFLVLITTLTCV